VSQPITLPFPPSTNNLFKNIGKGRARTAAYNAWINEALWMVKAQRPASVTGRFTFEMLVQRPDKRARDIDNLTKPVLDLLKKAGVIRDDSDAKRIVLEWSDDAPTKGAGVSVMVEAA
jgi:crossover junction endodeoxyribonuclease RusA